MMKFLALIALLIGLTAPNAVAQRNRCETPRHLRAPHRTVQVRPPFRYIRHIERFYYSKGHSRLRCTYCLQYDRWLHYRPKRYDPVRHICR